MHTEDRKLSFLGFRPTGDLADLTAYTSVRNKTVWFIKAPPLEPASPRQLRQRQHFRNAAIGWRALREETREDWRRAARRAHLDLCGYTLYLVWLLCPDLSSIRTIERLSGITLVR